MVSINFKGTRSAEKTNRIKFGDHTKHELGKLVTLVIDNSDQFIVCAFENNTVALFDL